MGLLCERTPRADRRGGRRRRAAQGRRAALRRLAGVARPPRRRGAQPRPEPGRAGHPRPALADHPRRSRRSPRQSGSRADATGVRSMVAVPLLHAGQPGRHPARAGAGPANAFDDADVRTLELLSVVISAAMSHAAEFRREVEALNRFRTVFEGASVGIVRARADGSAREVNEAILKMLGYTPEDHSTRELRPLHPPRRPGAARKELMGQLMAGEREYYDHDKRYVRKDGKVIWVHVRAWLEPRVEGEPRTAIAMIENINERKLAEIALRENSERLERSGRDPARHRLRGRGPRRRDEPDRGALAGADRGRGRDRQHDRRRRAGGGRRVRRRVPVVGNRRPLEQSIARLRVRGPRHAADRARRGRSAPVQRVRRDGARPLAHLRPALPGRTSGRRAERDDHVRRPTPRRGRPPHARAARGGARHRRSAVPPSSRPSAGRWRRWLASRPPTRAPSPGS